MGPAGRRCARACSERREGHVMERPGRDRATTARAVIVATALLAPAISRAGLREDELRWEQRFGPFEGLAEAHVLPSPNDSAKTLEGLARALGIDLVPKSRDRGTPHVPVRPDAKSPGAPPAEGRAWLAAEIARPEDRVAPIPAVVLEWHAAHQDTIEQVRHVLLAWKAPRWEEDLRDAGTAPLPNLFGLINLDKVLVADALIAESLGDTARAEADLEAAWNLARSLLDRAETISVLVSIGGAKRAAVALCKMSHPSDAWITRIEAGRFRDALLVGLRCEARLLAGMAEGRWPIDDGGADEFGFGDWRVPIPGWMRRRGQRFAAARSVRDLLPVAEDLAGPPRCDHRTVASAGQRSTLFGNTILSTGYFDSVPATADSLALQFELTRRVLALRQAAAEAGAFPATLPGGPAATSCPGHAWRWRTDGVTGHLEPVRVGPAGVGKWWDTGGMKGQPLEATLTLRRSAASR